jgi:hypothetical protein
MHEELTPFILPLSGSIIVCHMVDCATLSYPLFASRARVVLRLTGARFAKDPGKAHCFRRVKPETVWVDNEALSRP